MIDAYINKEIKDYANYIKAYCSKINSVERWLVGVDNCAVWFRCINEYHYQITESEKCKIYKVGSVYSLIELAKLIVSRNTGKEIP